MDHLVTEQIMQDNQLKNGRQNRFRLEMIKEIPRFPNTLETKIFMEEKSLLSVIIDYLSWRSRFIVARKREWTMSPAVLTNSHWPLVQTGMIILERAVSSGEDLTKFLSVLPRTQGVSPAGRWSDKDLILNIMGFHHFHLGPADCGYRSNELAFYRISRGGFEVFGLFDHDVFTTASSENLRLFDLHRKVLSGGNDGFHLTSNIASSGHPDLLVMHAMNCHKFINEHSERLSEAGYLEEVFGIKRRASPRQNLHWDLREIDLRLLSLSSASGELECYTMKQGWQ